MDVPLREVASYPRFHEAAGAAFQLIESSLGSTAHMIVHPVDGRLVVLKASPASTVTEGDDLPEDSRLHGFISDGASQVSGDVSLSPIVLPDGRRFGHIVTFTDEQGQPELEAAARLIGFAIDSELRTVRDRLTGLYRRWMFEDRMVLEVERSRRSSKLLAIVVVGFTLPDGPAGRNGHRWMPRIAERLQTTVRNGDTLGRLGAREFGLVVPDLSHVEAARRLALALHETLEDPYSSESGSTPPSAGVGIACFPGDGEHPKHLVAHAEQAMRIALASGAGYCLYGDLGDVTVHDG